MAPRRVCPAYPLKDSKHQWEQTHTPACREPWQWQNVCACGDVRDEGIYGVPPTPEEKAPVLESDINLDRPADVEKLVDALFDSGLNWTQAAARLGSREAFEQGQVWAGDERVTKAVGDYIRSMSTSNPVRQTLLLHHAEKYMVDKAETGAVRATAMNILKAARITEKSEQAQQQHIKITGLGDYLSGIGITDVPLPAPKEDELLN